MTNDFGWVRKHDQYQFEIKLGYDLSPQRRHEHYRVETFFFVPESLDVNTETYSKKQFYRDLILHIRFRTPDFSLAALANPSEERSPLCRLADRLKRYHERPSGRAAAAINYELRLLACIFRNALRQKSRAIEETFSVDPLVAAKILPRFLDEISRVLSAHRDLANEFAQLPKIDSLEEIYHFIDEYMSLMTESRCHHLLQALSHHGTSHPLRHLERDLVILIEREIKHRKDSGYPSLIDESGDNETYIYRQSVLKKFASSALHLRVHTQEEGRGLVHIAFALAAGLAMAIAAGIAFYYQRIYGSLSLSFFTVIVVSYMFRDRAKALLQQWLQRRLSGWLFDQSTDISDPLNGLKIGVCRELMEFVPEPRVDPKVVQIRNRDHITSVENNWRSERVIHYVKDITLRSRIFFRHPTRKVGIADIVRFNLRNFLIKMDEPVVDIPYLNNGRSDLLQATRVYHVNLVIKMTSPQGIRYERVRLVLTRRGIKRIEPVSTETIPGLVSSRPASERELSSPDQSDGEGTTGQ